MACQVRVLTPKGKLIEVIEINDEKSISQLTEILMRRHCILEINGDDPTTAFLLGIELALYTPTVRNRATHELTVWRNSG